MGKRVGKRVGNQDHQGPPKNTSTGISLLDFCYGTCWNIAEGRVTLRKQQHLFKGHSRILIHRGTLVHVSTIFPAIFWVPGMAIDLYGPQWTPFWRAKDYNRPSLDGYQFWYKLGTPSSKYIYMYLITPNHTVLLESHLHYLWEAPTSAGLVMTIFEAPPAGRDDPIRWPRMGCGRLDALSPPWLELCWNLGDVRVS